MIHLPENDPPLCTPVLSWFLDRKRNPRTLKAVEYRGAELEPDVIHQPLPGTMPNASGSDEVGDLPGWTITTRPAGNYPIGARRRKVRPELHQHRPKSRAANWHGGRLRHYRRCWAKSRASTNLSNPGGGSGAGGHESGHIRRARFPLIGTAVVLLNVRFSAQPNNPTGVIGRILNADQDQILVMKVIMHKGFLSLMAAAILILPTAVRADDAKHQGKEAAEAQEKADKAQAKADKKTAKYDETSYREYVKEQNKADKEWAKLDAKERKDYYKWLKKHKQ